jgi:hypothetical protein
MRYELLAVPFMMVVDMRDAEAIWRFGRWLAQRRDGVVRLSGASGELVLRVARGKIVSVEGPDPSQLARRLGGRPAGHRDLVAEAVALATAPGLAETQAIGAVKELVQQSLAAWLLDPERRLAIVESDVAGGESPTISAPHAVVELVLSSQNPAMTRAILPELDIRLRRSADFLELYSPLRLSEEADLIVAKVNGQRTASEIAGRSPQGHDDVLNLLAALVAAGMLEPAPAEEAVEVLTPVAVDEPPARRSGRRRVPPWILLAALAAVLAIVVVIALMRQRSDASVGHSGTGAEWGLVVDMGCEPQELQRVLRKVRQYPDGLRAVEAAGAEGSPCWRLIWGSFPSREAASRAIADIPAHLKLDGFTPHAVELPSDSEAGAAGGGEG